MEHLIDSPMFAVLLVAYLLFGVGAYTTRIVDFHERGMDRVRRSTTKRIVAANADGTQFVSYRATTGHARGKLHQGSTPPRRATTWPYTTPTGHTYTEPLNFAQTHEYCTTVAQAYLEGWDLDEWPPTPTNTMLTAVVHLTDRLIDEFAGGVLPGEDDDDDVEFVDMAAVLAEHVRQEDTASGAPRAANDDVPDDAVPDQFPTDTEIEFHVPTRGLGDLVWRPGVVARSVPFTDPATPVYEVVGDDGRLYVTSAVRARDDS